MGDASSDIRVGEPTGDARFKGDPRWRELADAALEHRGDWVSVAAPDTGKPISHHQNSIKQAVAQRVAEYSYRDGRVWVRIKI